MGRVKVATAMSPGGGCQNDFESETVGVECLSRLARHTRAHESVKIGARLGLGALAGVRPATTPSIILYLSAHKLRLLNKSYAS